MDLALACDPFVEEFAEHYTSGHAKVAPEHVVPEVLQLMMKPEGEVFVRFLEKFRRASAKAGKEQYVLPYIIAAHPGSRLEDMLEVALYLQRERLRVEQCQIFIPLPGHGQRGDVRDGDQPVHRRARLRRARPAPPRDAESPRALSSAGEPQARPGSAGNLQASELSASCSPRLRNKIRRST